jgi:hypothetical protein
MRERYNSERCEEACTRRRARLTLSVVLGESLIVHGLERGELLRLGGVGLLLLVLAPALDILLDLDENCKDTQNPNHIG